MSYHVISCHIMSYHLGRDDDKGKSARHLRKETQVNDGNGDDNDDMIFIIMMIIVMILMTKVRVPDIGGGKGKYHDFDYFENYDHDKYICKGCLILL